MTEHSAEVVEALARARCIRLGWNPHEVITPVPQGQGTLLPGEEFVTYPRWRDWVDAAQADLSALSAAGYAVAPIGAERAAGFAAGVRAGLMAAVGACEAQHLECYGQPGADPTDVSYDIAVAHCSEAVAAIDPASVKDTSDEG